MTPYQHTFPEKERRVAPPGMTQEQLDYFTEQTVRAVEKGTKKGVRRYRNNAIIGFLILLVGLFIVRYEDQQRADKELKARIAVANSQRQAIVESGSYVAVEGCNNRFKDRVEVRSILESSKKFAAREYADGQITKQRYDTAIQFYDERLAGLPLPDCRKSAGILTTDPKDVPPLPTALYPGSPQTKGTENAGKGGQDPGERPNSKRGE